MYPSYNWFFLNWILMEVILGYKKRDFSAKDGAFHTEQVLDNKG